MRPGRNRPVSEPGPKLRGDSSLQPRAVMGLSSETEHITRVERRSPFRPSYNSRHAIRLSATDGAWEVRFGTVFVFLQRDSGSHAARSINTRCRKTNKVPKQAHVGRCVAQSHYSCRLLRTCHVSQRANRSRVVSGGARLC